jgi:hypothetical protein
MKGLPAWPAIAFAFLFLIGAPLDAQTRTNTGSLSGVVSNESGAPLAGANIRVRPAGGGVAREDTSDVRGAFQFANLPSGIYTLTARKLGFREATLGSLRIITGQTASVRIALTASATQLSTVTVRTSSVTIDATTPELTQKISIDEVKQVPLGRDAASLVELVPGAHRGFVWGGAGDAANNYLLDGVPVNHPGVGGDFLTPGIDWVESLEVRGLGAGAEFGSFQGGIISAVTKTGTNERHGAMHLNYISPMLTSSNIQPQEEGAEQTTRTELSGEVRGPIAKDRLFYFATTQFIRHDLHVPRIRGANEIIFRRDKQDFSDLRGLAKLTFLPSLGSRVDLLVGGAGSDVERADLNGIDATEASRKVAERTAFYSLGWTAERPGSKIEARVGGFNSTENKLGYGGDNVPGIQIFSVGRQPAYQNSAFNERLAPQSISGNVKWETQHRLAGGDNRFLLGGELTRGKWKNEKTRNGGLTWRPYPDPKTGSFDPADAKSWSEVGSDWGGEIHLHSRIQESAVFAQDYFSPAPTLTFSPGIRYGRWSGWLTPSNGTNPEFLAVQASAVDPRIGVVWDISGRNTFVLKTHWGRYHQGMNALFFDRAQGADVYSNERFYSQGPDLTSPTQTFTAAQRDAMLDTTNKSFAPNYLESVLNEAGRVENYRQPYISQWIVGLEKSFGTEWKAEVSYTNRVNKDIVGLVDRNLATNYSRMSDVMVKYRIGQSTVYDHTGNPLILHDLWISNADLIAVLKARQSGRSKEPPVPGFSFGDLATLTYNPDIVLTTVADARRKFDQVSVSLRAAKKTWDGMLSLTGTSLKGNLPGLTAFGTTGTTFSAGSAVRPNEGINSSGWLPNINAFEGKLWVSANVARNTRAGAYATMQLGEYFAPMFQISPRFRFQASDLSLLEDELFNHVRGQTILLEERGARKYPPRTNLDLRVERSLESRYGQWSLSADLFNALGSDAITQRNLTVNDGIIKDPTSLFGAPRLRVPPRAVRVGAALEF